MLPTAAPSLLPSSLRTEAASPDSPSAPRRPQLTLPQVQPAAGVPGSCPERSPEPPQVHAPSRASPFPGLVAHPSDHQGLRISSTDFLFLLQ